jgi:hypothetical protein
MKPVHPGRILKRELKSRNVSGNSLALALRVPSGRISQILNQKDIGVFAWPDPRPVIPQACQINGTRIFTDDTDFKFFIRFYLCSSVSDLNLTIFKRSCQLMHVRALSHDARQTVE